MILWICASWWCSLHHPKRRDNPIYNSGATAINILPYTIPNWCTNRETMKISPCLCYWWGLQFSEKSIWMMKICFTNECKHIIKSKIYCSIWLFLENQDLTVPMSWFPWYTAYHSGCHIVDTIYFSIFIFMFQDHCKTLEMRNLGGNFIASSLVYSSYII